MEQKKRVRPTRTMVRELENKLAAANTAVVDSRKALADAKGLYDEDRHKFERELKHMSIAIEAHRNKIAQLEELADNRSSEIWQLKNRGFWARVLNR